MLLMYEVFCHWFFFCFFCIFRYDLSILGWCTFWLSSVVCSHDHCYSLHSYNCPGTHGQEIPCGMGPALQGKVVASQHHRPSGSPGEFRSCSNSPCQGVTAYPLNQAGWGWSRASIAFQDPPGACHGHSLGTTHGRAGSTLPVTPDRFAEWSAHFPFSVSSCGGLVFLLFCILTKILYYFLSEMLSSCLLRNSVYMGF